MSALSDSLDRPHLDPKLIERTAGALGVDETFVEKDWHVVRILHALGDLTYEDCKLVFGGGTSPSKAYGLIKRFSEDIDFRATPGAPIGALSEGKRRNFQKAVERAIEDVDYHIDEDRTERRNGNRMFTLHVPFNPAFPHPTLRPDVKVEVTLEESRLPTKSAAVGSFFGQFQGSAAGGARHRLHRPGRNRGRQAGGAVLAGLRASEPARYHHSSRQGPGPSTGPARP